VADADLPTRIRTRFEQLGLVVADRRLAQLASYFGLLTKWNKTVNLTSVELEPATDAAIDRLLVEPVLAAQHRGLRAADGLLIDLGSGGGSPAIPLKIALPGLKLLMIESRTRKAAFLREAARLLPLAETEVFNGRIEEAALRPDLRGAAGWVSIRAVRVDRELWDAVAAFLAPNGRVLWFRAPTDGAANTARFSIQEVRPLGTNSELAVLRKDSGTTEVTEDG
jgi:16S rRNA (guanine527-N7)-methyltransferase